jgi:hypothetical protein
MVDQIERCSSYPGGRLCVCVQAFAHERNLASAGHFAPLALPEIVRQQEGYLAVKVAAQLPVLLDWSSRQSLAGYLKGHNPLRRD